MKPKSHCEINLKTSFQGPAVYDPEANSNLKRFQSAFKVPDVRKVTLSHAVEKDGVNFDILTIRLNIIF